MVMHIEDELKQALRAEDPGAAFTQRVLARAREERSRGAASTLTSAATTAARSAVDGHEAEDAAALSPASVATKPATWRSAANMRRLIAAVAASLALTAAGAQYWRHVQYVAEGERARAQVLTALRLTSEKLNKVHDAITESTQAR
jgi:hypothetical protein